MPRLPSKEALADRLGGSSFTGMNRHGRRPREVAQTPAYACSKRERNKIEALFSELKLRVGLRRVRLRRLWNVSEQFYLAATAQNLKQLVRFLAQRESASVPCTT